METLASRSPSGCELGREATTVAGSCVCSARPESVVPEGHGHAGDADGKERPVHLLHCSASRPCRLDRVEHKLWRIRLVTAGAPKDLETEATCT